MDQDKKADAKRRKSAYDQEYIKTHYMRIMVSIPKEEGEDIKARAKELGLSVNAYFITLYRKEKREREKQKEGKW